MYEIKTVYFYKDFSKDKEMCHFSNFSTESKYYDNSNISIAGKMKAATDGVAFK